MTSNRNLSFKLSVKTREFMDGMKRMAERTKSMFDGMGRSASRSFVPPSLPSVMPPALPGSLGAFSQRGLRQSVGEVNRGKSELSRRKAKKMTALPEKFQPNEREKRRRH